MSGLACAWLVLAAAAPSPTPTPAPTPAPTSPIGILVNKTGGGPRGQSLAEVAKQIKLRLPADQPRRLDNEAVKALAQGVELTTTTSSGGGGAISVSGGSRAPRKEYWQRAYAEALARIPAQEKRIAELEAETARLQQDFYRWDDPAYRDGVIKPALDRALAQLNEARKQLEAVRKRPEEVKAEAAREGALPGWFREPLPTVAPGGPSAPAPSLESAPPGVTPAPRPQATQTPAWAGGR
ncbi:MAG TPA: hypothetical protein P5234_10960 [Thermoanaerobaculaceae bacterium]|nr:hypothetical protein [Thermoanaerobaculaceae bacterium]HRS16749.1 hypothetical protein [Thermoanaerobaculaceae bacterium]